MGHNVPLQSHMAFLHTLHIETHCGNGTECSRSVISIFLTDFPEYFLIGKLGNTYSIVNSPPYSCQSTTNEQVGDSLTAKTRNKDVLPAFCNPIIVISISVALCSAKEDRYQLGTMTYRRQTIFQTVRAMDLTLSIQDEWWTTKQPRINYAAIPHTASTQRRKGNARERNKTYQKIRKSQS
jgi:hypothetical protein